MNRDCSGFTLIETVVVLILVSVLSAYSVMQWPSDDKLKLPAQAELLASHIRHTQSLAMLWGIPLRLVIASGSYSVSCVAAAPVPPCNNTPVNNSPINDPVTGKTFNVILEPGITLSGTATTVFDALGRPLNGVNLETNDPASTLTLTANAVSTWDVTVLPLTGFVAATP